MHSFILFRSEISIYLKLITKVKRAVRCLRNGTAWLVRQSYARFPRFESESNFTSPIRWHSIDKWYVTQKGRKRLRCKDSDYLLRKNNNKNVHPWRVLCVTWYIYRVFLKKIAIEVSLCNVYRRKIYFSIFLSWF